MMTLISLTIAILRLIIDLNVLFTHAFIILCQQNIYKTKRNNKLWVIKNIRSNSNNLSAYMYYILIVFTGSCQYQLGSPSSHWK